MEIQETTLAKLKELFCNIEQTTGVRDIGYHEIRDGRLHPVYKTNTDILGIEKWKTVHGQKPVYIEETAILTELVKTKVPAVVQDVKHDNRSASAFFLFGIDSIAVMPILKNDIVTGIVCIAAIGVLHEFSKYEIEECSRYIMECFEK